MTLGNLGILAARAGDLERGRALIGEALALFEETDDAPGQMGMRLNLGHLAADAGEREVARALLEANRAMAEAQRLFRCVGWTTLALAELALADGDDGLRGRAGRRRGSRACARSATAGAWRGAWSSAKRPLRGR